MRRILPICLFVLIAGCSRVYKLQVPQRLPGAPTGSSFYKQAAAMNWTQRDSFVVAEILAGNIPSFLLKFVPVQARVRDSISGKTIEATYYVSPDYLSLGKDDELIATGWARVCITPIAAQQIADSFHCFLPTRKMVDDIYSAAKVKLEPVPMYSHRDSTPVMWQHHLIIEGQRKGRQGLIAGIKKDIVISGIVSRHTKPNRVAIYGWHKPDGKPIQPLYAGHINWYVDYSHGIRLVYDKIKVNGKWVDYKVIMGDKLMKGLLCDEGDCDFLRY